MADQSTHAVQLSKDGRHFKNEQASAPAPAPYLSHSVTASAALLRTTILRFVDEIAERYSPSIVKESVQSSSLKFPCLSPLENNSR